MLGLSPARLRAYVTAGLLCPQRGDGGQLRFSFQDLLLLRTAEGLVSERLPPRRVRDALLKLRQRLPAGRPLTGVQLGHEDGAVVMRDGARTWRADSGQGLLSFAAPAASGSASAPAPDGDRAGTVAALRPVPVPVAAGTTSPAPLPEAAPKTADDFYVLGCALEEEAPEAARVAYQNAISLDARHADAHVNLGRLMHESGDLEFAEEHYRSALALRPDDATACFNLGVVLEDRGRPEAAVETYEAALRADPEHADAHFNAARLHDRAGRYEAALRHLRAYRNLTTG